MKRKLRDYQIIASQKVRDSDATALYMEMRLGKTMSVIRGLGSVPKGYVLVIAPMVALWAWKRELELEGVPERYVVPLIGTKKQRLEGLDCAGPWFLVNYEGILACPEILENNWDTVVLDECRRIANPQAKTTKVLLKWSSTYPCKKVILSGNPAPESPLEYFTQMKLLYGSFMGCDNYWQFRNYHFREYAPHDWNPKPGVAGRIKEEIHKNAFVLTRKDAKLKETKLYQVRTVRLCPNTRSTYKKVLREFLLTWKGKVVKSTKWVPVQYIWLHQISSGFIEGKLVDRCKINELLSLVEGELKNEQIVVWYRYNSGITASSLYLKQAGISHGILQGDVSIPDREKAINDFRNGRQRILLCQIKVAKEAIDLSNSSTAIYFTNSHSLDERMQSEDRIVNPSKKDPCLYIDLVTEDTVDEDIVVALKDKKMDSRFFLTRLLEKLRG